MKKVLIDLESIKCNPNVGASSYMVAGPMHRVGDEMVRTFQRVQTMVPEGPYLFKHEPYKPVCTECGKSVMLADIETVYDDDESGDDQCPRCMSLNSFEPCQYETIGEAMKRKYVLFLEKRDEH